MRGSRLASGTIPFKASEASGFGALALLCAGLLFGGRTGRGGFSTVPFLSEKSESLSLKSLEPLSETLSEPLMEDMLLLRSFTGAPPRR